MSKLSRKLNDAKKTSPLLQYASDVTSQGGEDGIIDHLFNNIIPWHTTEKRFCVDVGAWDGIHLSNTHSLLKERCWSGVLLEADEGRSALCKELYSLRDDVKCVCSLVQLFGLDTLANQLVRHDVPIDFDFLSIDVDGADYHLWKSLDGLYSPKVVCIEFNPTIPNRVFFVQEPNTKVQQGSSLLAMRELAAQLGYTLIVTTTFNAFFIRNDLMCYLRCFDLDLSLDDFNPCSMTTDIFQTYDGELKFVGPTKMMWHRKSMNPQKLQILPKKDMNFPFAPPWNRQLDGIASKIQALSKAVATFPFFLTQINDSMDALLTHCSQMFSFASLEGFAMDGIIAGLHILQYAGMKCISNTPTAIAAQSSTNERSSCAICAAQYRRKVSECFSQRAEVLAPRDIAGAGELHKKALFVLFFGNNSVSGEDSRSFQTVPQKSPCTTAALNSNSHPRYSLLSDEGNDDDSDMCRIRDLVTHIVQSCRLRGDWLEAYFWLHFLHIEEFSRRRSSSSTGEGSSRTEEGCSSTGERCSSTEKGSCTTGDGLAVCGSLDHSDRQLAAHQGSVMSGGLTTREANCMDGKVVRGCPSSLQINHEALAATMRVCNECKDISKAVSDSSAVNADNECRKRLIKECVKIDMKLNTIVQRFLEDARHGVHSKTELRDVASEVIESDIEEKEHDTVHNKFLQLSEPCNSAGAVAPPSAGACVDTRGGSSRESAGEAQELSRMPMSLDGFLGNMTRVNCPGTNTAILLSASFFLGYFCAVKLSARY